MRRRRDADGAEVEEFLASHAPVPSPATLGAGTVAGSWKIAAFLGRGGAAEVYRAVHVSLPLAAALKVMLPAGDAEGDAVRRTRFDRETQFLYENRSSSFPRFLGSGEVAGRPFVAMELLEPADLPSSGKAVASFILAVSEAVLDLHAKGLVHRDLKPRNIMKRADGSVVVVDFGMARPPDRRAGDALEKRFHADTLAASGARRYGGGTPRYGAPEQFEGGEVAFVSDVHALGMIVYECFGGRPPRCWAKIVRRATSSIPEQRYANVASFMRAVRSRHAGAIGAAALAAAAVAAAVAVAIAIATGMPAGRDAPQPVRAEEEPAPAVPAVLSEETKLGGKTLAIPGRIVLEAGKTYSVEGPGTLDADISSPADAVLRLKNCVFLNRTGEVYPQNAVRYVLDGGVYLNFISIPGKPPNLRLADFIEPFDGALNKIRFAGPGKISQLMRPGDPDFDDLSRNFPWYWGGE